MARCNNCKNLETKDNGFDAYSWCEKINDCPHEDIERDCEHYAPMTNADRIRSMTDEELADFLVTVETYGYHDQSISGTYEMNEWLLMESEEEDGKV
ncbi:MAG: hypothetical protein UDF85_08880 [Lachnospiraceae bacterium]|nr:hypothetical protein [Lachnospiraceae bacterium]